MIEAVPNNLISDRDLEIHCTRWMVGHCFSDIRAESDPPCWNCRLAEIAGTALQLVNSDSVSHRGQYEKLLSARLARIRRVNAEARTPR